MWTRRVIGIALGIALVALSFVPMFGQGSLSDQVLRLLDRENTWTKKQTIAASYGLQLNDGAPTVTTNKLYQQANVLYWNGSAVASGGGGSSNWTLVGGTTLVPLTIANRVRVGTSGTAAEAFYVDGTMRVTGATTFNSTVATGALTPASVGVTGAATVGTTLNVTGAAVFSSTVSTGALSPASLAVTNAATVGTTLGVTGVSTLNSLGVTNAATIGTTLGVTQVATLSAGAIFGNNTGTTAGTIRWTGTNFEGYSGVGWVALDQTPGSGAGWTENAGTNTVHLTTGTRKVSIGAGTTAPAFLGILGTTEQIRVANTANEYMKLTVSNTAIATFDAVSAGATAAFTFADPVTFSGNIEVVSTTAAQFKATYDGTNYATLTVGATGIVSLDATSATAADAFTIADPTTINNNLVVQKTTGNQFSVIQQTGQRMDLAVSSAGIAAFDATGTSHAFTFADPVTINSNMEAVSTAGQQARFSYDGTSYVDLTVASTGIVSLTSVEGAGVASFSFNAPVALGAAAVGEIQFREPSGTGTDYVALKAPSSVTTSLAFVLPAADGTAGQALTTDGSKNLGWSTTSATGMANPMTTKGDIIYASNTAATSTPARLGLGTVGQCLVSDAGTTDFPKWGSCAAGATVAGADTQVQYNNAGAFGANGAFTYTAATATLGLVGATTGARVGLQVSNTGTGSADTVAFQLGNSSSADALSLKLNSHQHTLPDVAYLWNKVVPSSVVIGASNAAVLTLNSTGMELTSSGILTMGGGTLTGMLNVTTNGGSNWGDFEVNNNSTSTGSLNFYRSRGTIGSKTAAGSGDQVVGLVSRGYDGSAYRNSSEIQMSIDGAVTGGGAADMPGSITMYTALDGTASLLPRLIIKNDGKVGIGTLTPAYQLDVVGDMNITGVYRINGTSSAFLGAALTDTWATTCAYPTSVCSTAVGTRGSNSAISGIPAVGKGTFLANFPTDYEEDYGGVSTIDITGFPVIRSYPTKRITVNSSGNDYTEGYTHFIIDSPGVTERILDGMNSSSSSGRYQPSFLSPDFWYDGATRTLRLNGIRLMTIGDPTDLSIGRAPGVPPHEINVAGNTDYQLIGHIGFRQWEPNNGLGAYFAAVHGTAGGSAGRETGMLLLSMATGHTNVSRGMANNEDPQFPDGSWVGTSQASDELTQHIALHSSGQFEIGFQTDPAMVKVLTTTPFGALPLLLVRGAVRAQADVGAWTSGWDHYIADFQALGNSADRRGVRISAGTNANTGSNYLMVFADGDGDPIGAITATGSVTSYETSSDRRLKEHIIPTAIGLETLLSIQVRDFNFISDPQKTVRQGFIAQELYAIYPLAVTVGTTIDNPWSVDYSKLTPLLVQSVQELTTKVATLEARIAQLEARH